MLTVFTRTARMPRTTLTLAMSFRSRQRSQSPSLRPMRTLTRPRRRFMTWVRISVSLTLSSIRVLLLSPAKAIQRLIRLKQRLLLRIPFRRDLPISSVLPFTIRPATKPIRREGIGKQRVPLTAPRNSCLP